MSDANPIMSLTDPWLVAVWPGTGNVALSAGGYLIEKLDVTPLATLSADRHFDVDRAVIEDGVVLPGRLPRSQFYTWKNPYGGKDLVIFAGEAQPATETYEFCNALLRIAKSFNVRRVFTFASMVTPTPPTDPSSIYAVATERSLLEEVRVVADSGIQTLKEGEIGGLNGTLLAAAAAQGMEGIGILGEVPQIATNVPYLKASRVVLELFTRMAGFSLDFSDLESQASAVEEGLQELMRRMRSGTNERSFDWNLDLEAFQAFEAAPDTSDMAAASAPELEEEDEPPPPEPSATAMLDPETLAQIEAMFLDVQQDLRSANELKDALDEHGVFKDYEDRFLDLFR